MATARGRARQVQAPVSLARIQEEAIRLFGEKTFAATGMRDISDAVGILPGSLYAHISSKEQLLMKVAKEGIQNYLDVMEPIAAGDEPADVRLRGLVHAYMRVLGRTLPQTRVAFDQWHYLGPENRQKIVVLRERYEALFAKVLDDGITAGTFAAVEHRKVAILAVIGMLNSMTTWYSADRPLGVDDIAEALADVVLVGLVAR